MSTFKLPELPYSYDALEPVLSTETLRFHHDRHHRAYVDKLNELVVDSDFKGSTLDEIILQASGPLFNNAAQHWNHSFFWKCLTPPTKTSTDPSSALLKKIDTTFGSLEGFKKKFEEAGKEHFGSGWAWLVLDEKRNLKIQALHDADNPMKKDATPLLVCDLWEHAYYIDYRNERPKYLSQFWKIANWKFAETLYTKRVG